MITLQEILTFIKDNQLEASYMGQDDLIIKDFSSVQQPKPNTTIAITQNYQSEQIRLINSLPDILVICDTVKSDYYSHCNRLITTSVKLLFYSIMTRFFIPPSSSNSSVVQASTILTSKIGTNVSIGHHCYIGPDAQIDDHVQIKNNVSISGSIFIGKHTVICDGVVIDDSGFSYYNSKDGQRMQVPFMGGVWIGEHVEIGPNTTIRSGEIDDTQIHNHTKIAGNCYIDHNTIIEENVLIVALTCLLGYTHIKKNAFIGAGAIVKNRIVVGENALVGMGTVVTKDVPNDVVVAGVPAKILRDK